MSDLAMRPDQFAVIKQTIFPGCNDDQLALYVHDCKRHGVHPMDGMIYPQLRKGRYVAITSIDFLRARADSTGLYAGNDDPVFGGEPKTPGFTATATVYKLIGGQRCGFSATARWPEYCPEQNAFMWQKMPHTMLGKCAEALALRKAFPQQLAKLYTGDEMDQAGPPTTAGNSGNLVTAKLPPPPPPPQVQRLQEVIAQKQAPQAPIDKVRAKLTEQLGATPSVSDVKQVLREMDIEPPHKLASVDDATWVLALEHLDEKWSGQADVSDTEAAGQNTLTHSYE